MLEQNVLDVEQMIDDDWRLLTIALIESFWLLRLFCDKYVKNNNFSTLFLDIQDHVFNVHIKK
jgi:hypothetical protein